MFLRNRHNTPARRGSILVIVLAMLALFAVVGLSFVLYSESEATSMRNASGAVNQASDPDTQEVSNDFLRQLLFDTNDNTSAVYGHGLATTKYGWNGFGQNLSPYAGNGLPPEDVSAVLGLPPGTLFRQGMVNYTRNGAGQFVNPNLKTDGTTPINKSTSYTYADRANFYLAIQNPTTGEIVQPSFLRPDLFGPLDPTNGGAASNNWTNAAGRYLTVRPRPAENPNFPLVPANADGSYTGDVQNMKLIAGNTQKNDSIWMYTGGPVKTWRNKKYAACVAPLILDLSGRVNMSAAGNNRNGGAQASNQGFGAWEVNPTQLGISAADLQAILSNRYNGPNAPGNRYTGSPNGTINGGLVPPQYALIDSDGVGSGAADPMTVPAAGTYNPFLAFTPRFAGTQANFGTELTNHPQTFNPFHWPRGVQSPSAAHTLGMDDLVRLGSRYIDPKNRYAQTELGAYASFGAGTAAAQQNRALTTGFNVTQSWAEVQIPIGGGAFAKLGPVDLNRKLPDYRTDSTQPYTPANIDPTSAFYANARIARQRLAMDIFLRLAALSGLVDGTNVTYNPSTHCLNPVATAYANFDSLRRLAQYSANIVDAIDNDDIMTTFVWNPIVATPDPTDTVNLALNTAAVEIGNRVVYGTELPRLVVNEAYCELVNDRTDPATVLGKQVAKKPVQKKYWLELHNPLPNEPGTSLMSDFGGARLQYQVGVTPGYAGATTYGVYEIQIGETAGPVNIAAPTSNVTGDPAGIAGFAVKCQVSTFTDDATGPSPASLLAGTDNLNLVKPATAGTGLGTNGKNEGYYVLGPRDKHPAGNVINTISLPDPGAIAANPLNAMMYDANTPDKIAQAAATKSCVILRRLANPYQPPQLAPAVANYNPYISVDSLDNIPTRNRVDYDDQPRMAALPADATRDLPSNGRIHPYGNTPVYGAANALVMDQVNNALPTPAHTFFNANTSYNNTAFVHFDRELINSSELMHVSIQPPHLLTAAFGDGAGNFNLHNRITPASITALLDSQYPAAGFGAQLFKAFDLLTAANRMPGIPLGGREPGKINLNTVAAPGTDPRILRAVLDPQQGNSFGNLGDVAWQNTIVPTRTPNWPAVRGTADETGAPTGDRPFKLASGAATFDDTLFRSQTGLGGAPMLFNTGYPTSLYLQAEAHRKAATNLTTVSDGFLVIWTVGFFEIDESVTPYVVGNVPILGKELFDKVPGDLRAQYAAVVDRSTIQVPLAPAARTNGAKPWETKLVADAPVGSTTITVEGSVVVNAGVNNLRIFVDGNFVDVAPGAQIRLGTGDSLAAIQGEGEWVTIANPPVTPPQAINAGATPGQVTITLAAGTTRFHGGSARVSNTLPGNPGPQPTFDPGNAANRHIVPYFTKLDP